MRLPISVALGYPDRLADAVPPTVVEELDALDFHALDEERFPGVGLARRAAAEGGGRTAVLNAANEEAVNAFLAGAIPFSGIVGTVERAVGAFPGAGESLPEILEADRWAREYVKVNSGRLKT
jgi:1-deoxy-D-xylulose-5-phosphate reductoisomerase